MFGRAGRSFGRMGAIGSLWTLDGASLDIDFVNARGWQVGAGQTAASDLLTTTRASDAYADNSAGVWSLFASNVPRITDKGLLVEESRTNSIRNNSMQGAVAGTPGTLPTNWLLSTGASALSREVVGAGTESGIDYIDIRLFGTAASASPFVLSFDPNSIVATSGQTWTCSFFYKLVAGSNSNITTQNEVREVNSGGGFLTNSTSTITPTVNGLSGQRSVLARTLNNASTAYVNPQIAFTPVNGAAIDITLRIGWPQLELGAFATSPIRTTSAAATRAADAITVNDFSSWFNAAEGTLFAELDGPLAATASTARIFGLTNDANNLLQLWHWSGSPGLARFRGLSSGASQFDFATTGALAAGPHKIAGAYKLNDSNFAEDGTAKTADTNCTIPTLTGAAIDGINTYIRRVAYFPTRLSNAQLQALTS